MKIIPILMTVLLGLSLTTPEVEARPGGGGGLRARGGNSGGGGGFQRSPMTGSRVQRPQPKQIQRPAIQRPAIQKPTVQKPISRPDTGKIKIPERRPESRPSLPEKKPEISRPEKRPEISRPDNRPSISRPDGNRPTTLPGMVTYPDRAGKDKPDHPNLQRPGNNNNDRPNPSRPGNNNDRPGRDKPSIVDRDRVNIRGNDFSRDRNNIHIDKINVGGRNVGLNRPATLPGKSRDWDAGKWGGNNSVWGNKVNIGNDVNINVDNHFRHNNNFSLRPNYWGARPWWGAGNYHPWHHGHWGYGWNSSYYHRHWWYDDDDFAEGFMWGIMVWSLGNMVYDMGYHTYQNPYPAPPVQNTYITYEQPVSVAAAENPPGDEEAAATADARSTGALEDSRNAFKNGDYFTALKSCDEALAYTPEDITLHEYRALIFFALGKYGDAAGILNPVLASGPGWGWDTMISFYGDSSTYSDQLKKLEEYAKGAPDKADGRFLLGYHYMVCGHMEEANTEFAKAAELQPADSISRQLRDLTADTIENGKSDAEPEAAPTPVPAPQLVGTWISDRGKDGKVTFTMTADGNYTWNFSGAGDPSEIKGTYGLNEKGLLVLNSDDTQMVSAVTLEGGEKLHFVLIGAPDGDPGLDFTKG